MSRGNAPRGYSSTPRFTVGTKRPGFDTVLACATAAAVTHAAAATRLRAAAGVRAPDWLRGRGTAHHARARGLAGPAAQDPYRAGRGTRAASARRPSARTRHPSSPALHQHWFSRRGAGHGCRCAAPTTMRAQAVWLAQRHRIHAGQGAAPARPAPGDHPRAHGTPHLRCGWLQGWMIGGAEDRG